MTTPSTGGFPTKLCLTRRLTIEGLPSWDSGEEAGRAFQPDMGGMEALPPEGGAAAHGCQGESRGPLPHTVGRGDTEPPAALATGLCPESPVRREGHSFRSNRLPGFGLGSRAQRMLLE